MTFAELCAALRAGGLLGKGAAVLRLEQLPDGRLRFSQRAVLTAEESEGIRRLFAAYDWRQP